MVHGSLGEARLSMPRASQGEQHGLLCVGKLYKETTAGGGRGP